LLIELKKNHLKKKINNLNLKDKTNIILKIGDIKSCEKLWKEWLVRNCKNGIYISEANKKLDENICDKIESAITIKEFKNTQINICKNWVITKKAVKNLDKSICKKLDKRFLSICESKVNLAKIN